MATVWQMRDHTGTTDSPLRRGWTLGALGRRLGDFHNHTILARFGRVIFVTYGVIAGAAFLLGGWAALYFVHATGGAPLALLRFTVLILLPAVLLGARGFSVLLEWRKLLVQPLATLLKPGYMLHGGVFGGAAAIAGYSFVTGSPMLSLFDAFAFALPLGESIARVGCHVYGCCWGKPSGGGFGIAYTSPHAKVVRCAPELRGVRLYPVQMIGSGAHLLQFAIFVAVAGALPVSGLLTGLYLLTHPLLRVALERLRNDDRGSFIGPLTHTNFYSLLQFIAGGILMWTTAARGTVSTFRHSVPWSALGTEPLGVFFLVAIFLLAAAAFGIHLERVGAWMGPKQARFTTTIRGAEVFPPLVVGAVIADASVKR